MDFFVENSSPVFLITAWSYVATSVQAQQNNTLFFMHSFPEANFVNPAVQIDCGIFVGLPFFPPFT